MSGCILHLSILHSPVFLLNSCLDLFSAPRVNEDPLSRSYRVNLPNSLTMNLPSALVYSTRLRVSVCGTGSIRVKLSGFSREYDYLHYRLLPRKVPYCRVSAQGVDLPAPLIAYARQRAVPSARGSVTAPSPRRPSGKSRNVDRVSHRHRRSA